MAPALVTELLRQGYAQESALFADKREAAEQQRAAAQRDYEKILSRKKGVLGHLRVAHSDVGPSGRWTGNKGEEKGKKKQGSDTGTAQL